MATDIVDAFLKASTAERLLLLSEPANQPALEEHLGREAFGDYLKLAERTEGEHLAVTHAPNLIFVPGVMGSLLQSRTKGGVWWIDVRTRRHIDDLRLSPDGSGDADINNAITPFASDPNYEPFLTAILNRNDFGHEIFPYDWRKSLKHSADAFRELVVRCHKANDGPVHIVAHSMGGLMVRTALMIHGGDLWDRIDRIVFVGTPHYGATAIAGYLKNHLWGFELMALLGTLLSRDTFRTLRGVLSLLPAPRGVYPDTRPDDLLPWRSGDPSDFHIHPAANFDLYDASSWRLELNAEQTRDLQSVLDETAAFHRDLHAWHKSLSQEQRDRMLVIAGVGIQTLFRLEMSSAFFGVWRHMAKVTDRVPGNIHRDGDGRVPLASATLGNVRIRYVRGVHGGLTNIPAVYRDVFHWLKKQPMELPDTAEGALSRHLAADTTKSEAPFLDATWGAHDFNDDAGLWRLEDPTEIDLAALKAKLEAEQLPEFGRIRLL